MSVERPFLSRSNVLTLAMLFVVLAFGIGGMLLARHFHPSAMLGAAAVSGPPVPAHPSALPVTATPVVSGGVSRTGSGGEAQPAVANTTTPPMATPGTPGYEEEDAEIELVLRRWQKALLSNDAGRIAPSYAAQVERYFLQTDVNRAFVRSYLRTQEAHGSRLLAYDLKDISIAHVSGSEVDVRFAAGFVVSTPNGDTAGSARTLLKLRPEDGDWKIFFERDYSA